MLSFIIGFIAGIVAFNFLISMPVDSDRSWMRPQRDDYIDDEN